jgi:phage regulator Rha-like protein
MKNKNEIVFIPNERIINRILLIRGKKVMLDKDLAELYDVETKVLVQAVKRNIDRFPADFMFQLNEKEFKNMRSQFVTSSWGGRRYMPYVFTEQGVAMLSSILNSKKAIMVNIQIIRTFIKLKELLATNKKIRDKIQNMEQKYDTKLKQVFDILKQLLMRSEPVEKKGQIGFRKQ